MANNPPLLKNKDKPRKEKARSASWWQKKCDDLMQDAHKTMAEKCEVCSGPNQVGHHYITKSLSSYLRYDFNNLIPLCHGCHFKHHIKNDPHIHNTINRKRGDTWLNYIENTRRLSIKTGVPYYKQVAEDMKRIINGK